MTGRSPARLLAPLALVAVAVALYAVLSSDRGDSGTSTSSGTPTPAATQTSTSSGGKSSSSGGDGGKAKTYTVKAGDTPSGIAEELGVSVDDLLAANPDADPRALTVGDKLKLP